MGFAPKRGIVNRYSYNNKIFREIDPIYIFNILTNFKLVDISKKEEKFREHSRGYVYLEKYKDSGNYNSLYFNIYLDSKINVSFIESKHLELHKSIDFERKFNGDQDIIYKSFSYEEFRDMESIYIRNNNFDKLLNE